MIRFRDTRLSGTAWEDSEISPNEVIVVIKVIRRHFGKVSGMVGPVFNHTLFIGEAPQVNNFENVTAFRTNIS